MKNKIRKNHIPACPENCQAWHSPSQIAALLSVSRVTIYRLMNTKQIDFVKKDFGRRIHHSEILRFLEKQ